MFHLLIHCCICSNIRSASYLNPLNWVKEKLVPAVREKQAKEEVEAGKQQATEEGTQSVFETVPTPVCHKAVSKRTSTTLGIRKPIKPRPTLVRGLGLYHYNSIHRFCSSINIPLPISRFLIAN